MQKLLSTKDVAMAIGVSESSLRRWTDEGAIQTARTPGGHRRIPLSEAIRFIRDTHATVIRPAVLGLPDVAPDADSSRSVQAAEQLHRVLLEGNAAGGHAHVISMYLGGMSVAAIGDGPIQLAMQRIGELWCHSGKGLLVEHRATDICIGAVSAIRQLLPEPARDAPLAIGGTPPGDPYLLPSAMAAAVLAEAGWREANFGPRVPLELLADAAREREARLVWLSVSHVEDSKALHKGLRKLASRLSSEGVPLAIGGRCTVDLASANSGNTHFMQTMSELSAFARGVFTARPRPRLGGRAT
jgi:MerR family transcriptional regulator, light-induced transcriptional regulator